MMAEIALSVLVVVRLSGSLTAHSVGWFIVWCESLSHHQDCAKGWQLSKKILILFPLVETLHLTIRRDPLEEIFIASKLSELKEILGLNFALPAVSLSYQSNTCRVHQGFWVKRKHFQSAICQI
jgi:hypothetical protein